VDRNSDNDMMKRKRKYSTGNAKLDAGLEKLLDEFCSGDDKPYILQIATSAFKLAIEDAKRVDLKIANAALKEMRYAFKVFTPYRRARKVTVFGSARTEPGHPDYEGAVELGRRMAQSGWMVVTGAGSGIMGAAHEGAGRKMSFGVNIHLPFEQRANPVISGDWKLLNFRYFFTRKLFLLKESSAVVLFPGGFGTMDETFEVLTLLQTGRQTPIPVVMVENPKTGYFRALAEFIDNRLIGGELIAAEDTSLYYVAQTVEEACEEVFQFYRLYHSSRYIGDKLMIRLRRGLTKSELEHLNVSFGDILRSGRIESGPALPEERDDAQLEALARIQLDFNRKSFGRLRQLIDAINNLG
jgi:uncharacterized protein (TIGR00730 family)